MNFSERLKSAMQQLGINQAKVVSLTGKSKGSISQYLNNKQTPSSDVQRDIAVSLGLAPDFFENEEAKVEKTSRVTVYVPEIRTSNVGKLLRMNHRTVEQGLIQGVFPWGYAIETSPGHHRYFINAERFAEIEGIAIPAEMVV